MHHQFAVKAALLCILLNVIDKCVYVSGHGRLWEPPARSTMWRRGYNTTVNINDNELSCGGYMNHWVLYRGLCGVCGDPYQQRPRDNEAGGKYASGIITRGYLQGSVIDVKVDLTANHGGHFEFKICPTNHPKLRATPSCFVKHRLVVLGPHGDKNRYVIKDRDVHGLIPIQVKLPEDLTCTQCVLQWSYITASRWHCDDGSDCRKGVGPQEQFYGCSDVAVFNAIDFKSNPIKLPNETESAPPPASVAHSHKHYNVHDRQRIALALKSEHNPYRFVLPDIQKALQTNHMFTLKRPTDTVTSFFQKLILDAIDMLFFRNRRPYYVTAENCIGSEVYLDTSGVNNWCSITCDGGLNKCPLRMCYCMFHVGPKSDHVDDGATQKDMLHHHKMTSSASPSKDTDAAGIEHIHKHPPMMSESRTQPARRRQITKTALSLSNSVHPLLSMFDGHEAIGNNMLTILGGDGGAATEQEQAEVDKVVSPSKLSCIASVTFRHNPFMTNWCMQNCGFGFCPSNVCTCK